MITFVEDKTYFDMMERHEATVIVTQRNNIYGRSIQEVLELSHSNIIYCKEIPTASEAQKIACHGIKIIVIEKLKKIPPGNYTKIVEILQSADITIRKEGNPFDIKAILLAVSTMDLTIEQLLLLCRYKESHCDGGTINDLNVLEGKGYILNKKITSKGIVRINQALEGK